MKIGVVIIFIIIFIIINIISVYSLRLSVSPANIIFDAVINEEICKKISISSDKILTLDIEDKWKINEKSSLIQDYNLTQKDIDIKTSYQKEITVQDRKNINLCIRPEKEGIYNGVLIFNSKNSPAGIGILINLNVFESNSNKNYNEITGKVIEDDLDEKEKNSNLQLFLIINSIFLILLFLIIKIKYPRNNKLDN